MPSIGCKGEPKKFSWPDYRDLIIAAHRQLSAPGLWCWDNLNIRLAPELAEFAAENKGNRFNGPLSTEVPV